MEFIGVACGLLRGNHVTPVDKPDPVGLLRKGPIALQQLEHRLTTPDRTVGITGVKIAVQKDLGTGFSNRVEQRNQPTVLEVCCEDCIRGHAAIGFEDVIPPSRDQNMGP